MAPKSKNTKTTVTSVVEPVVQEPVVQAPVVQETVVQEVKAPEQKVTSKNTKTTNKKVTKQKVEPVVEPVAVVETVKETEPVVTKEAKGLKKKSNKTVEKVAVEKVAVPEVEADADGEVDGDIKTRSFKVQLPGEELFAGRFTGLTPYQAANKALSKYFRTLETDANDDVQVNFSIKESTRGSKRHTYTYRGNRLKLEKPITYTIKSLNGEERVITKQYKNQLIKIKKNVAKQQEVAAI